MEVLATGYILDHFVNIYGEVRNYSYHYWWGVVKFVLRAKCLDLLGKFVNNLGQLLSSFISFTIIYFLLLFLSLLKTKGI